MKLYGFGESGNAYKVALMLSLTKTPWTLEFVRFFTGGTRTPEFRAVNAMGEVPVLVDGDLTITQSGVMLAYLADQTGQFGGRDSAERREVMRWLLWDNHKLSTQIGTVRFLMNFLPVEKRSDAVIAFLQGRLKAAYAVLDTQLANSDWLAAQHPTIADLSCCGYLYYPEPYGFDRANWPHIAAWLDRIAALPGWQHPYDLMPRAFAAP